MNSHFLSALNRLAYRAERKTRSWLRPEQFATLPPILESLQDAYASQWKHARCVFVLSTGRAGTQSLTHLLSICPQIHSEHEPNPRLIQASYQYYQQSLTETCMDPGHWQDVVMAARDDLIFEANRAGRIYLETNNRMAYLAPVLAHIFPASQFIHLHRHPFEFVRSGVRRGYYKNHNWDFARIHPAGQHADTPRWSQMSQLAKVSWNWAAVNQRIMNFMHDLPTDRGLTLAAKDLFCADAVQIQNLYDFLQVSAPAFERLQTFLARPMNQQTEGEFPAGSHWREDERRTVIQEVAPVATALGYELS